MAVVTISRQYGAGGKTLGKMIANAMDYTFADSDIIQQIAKEANVLSEGQMIIMPANIPHALEATQAFKMMLIMIKG